MEKATRSVGGSTALQVLRLRGPKAALSAQDDPFGVMGFSRRVCGVGWLSLCWVRASNPLVSFVMQRFFAVCVVGGWLAGSAAAQVPSGSSSSSGGGVDARAQQSSSSARPGGQPEAGGAAITLETSEPLALKQARARVGGLGASLLAPNAAPAPAQSASSVSTTMVVGRRRRSRTSGPL